MSISLSGSLVITGSIIASAGITGSFSGSATTSSYATTASSVLPLNQTLITSGSTLMTGSLQVTGSISTTGTITAQTLVVSTVSSSIEYASGSNIFGNLMTNVQQMTGSLKVTGSITQTGTNTTTSFAGLVGIGTTTPAYNLDVTGTGRFTSYVLGGNFTSNIATTNTINVGQVTSDPNYNFVGKSGYWGLRTDTSFGFNIDTYNSNTPKNVLNITQTGAATFSSTGKFGGGTTTQFKTLDVVGSISQVTTDWALYSTGSYISYQLGATTGNTYGNILVGTAGGTANGELRLNGALTLASTGAATFSSSVAIGDYLSVTGDTTLKSNTYLRYNNTYLYGRNIADTTYTTMIGYGNDGNINIANQKLLINPSTGAATFSSGIGIGGATATTGGIQFPATQVSSTDANNLDDYEEGTWTPTVVAVTGTYTTVTNQRGSYTKIGRQVTVQIYFIVSAKGTGSGGASITNLPFAAASSAAGDYYIGTGTDTSTSILFTIQVQQGSTTAYIYKYDGTDPIVAGHGNNFSVTYFTA